MCTSMLHHTRVKMRYLSFAVTLLRTRTCIAYAPIVLNSYICPFFYQNQPGERLPALSSAHLKAPPFVLLDRDVSQFFHTKLLAKLLDTDLFHTHSCPNHFKNTSPTKPLHLRDVTAAPRMLIFEQMYLLRTQILRHSYWHPMTVHAQTICAMNLQAPCTIFAWSKSKYR